MLKHKKLRARILSIAVSVAMVFTTTMPVAVFATDGAASPQASTKRTITAFDTLGEGFEKSVLINENTYVLNVKPNTPFKEVRLPTELFVTVETTTTPPPATEPAGSPATEPTGSPATEPATEQKQTTVTKTTQEKVSVTWKGDTAYTSDPNSKVTYTAELPKDYAIADSAKPPAICVMVGNQTIAVAKAILPRTTPLDLATNADITYIAENGITSKTANPTKTSITDTGEGWTWDLGSKTLTLFGANIDCSGNPAAGENIFGIQLISDCKIVLTDGTTNTVKAGSSPNFKSHGVYYTGENGNASISGRGTLNATGGDVSGTSSGIFCTANKLTVSEATITASSSALSNNGIGINANLDVQSGTITATATGSLSGYGIKATRMTMSDGTVTATGKNTNNTNDYGIKTQYLTLTGGTLKAYGKTGAIAADNPITATGATATGAKGAFASGTTTILKQNGTEPVVVSFAELTAQPTPEMSNFAAKAVTEQFTLPTDQLYYFDLSSEIGTVTHGVSDKIGKINKEPTDPNGTLRYVPFFYAGTVNAYSLDKTTDSGTATTEERANALKSDRSLFVANYNISEKIIWEQLNTNNLIFGKSFDTNYKLRSLSVGSSATGTGDTMSGLPATNEWDSILNKSKLPYPIGNYSNYRSWGQDTAKDNTDHRALRGDEQDNYWYSNSYNKDDSYSYNGFRPALEVLNPSTLGTDGLKAVTLDLNGGHLGNELSFKSIQIVCAGENFKAPSGEGLTPPNEKTFDKWTTAKDGSGTSYAVGDTVLNTVDMLYAQWKEVAPAISFDARNGVTITDANITDDKVTLPADPKWGDYTFAGWYTGIDGNGTEFANSGLTTSKTVYAKWIKGTKTVRTQMLDIRLNESTSSDTNQGWSWDSDTKTLTLSGATIDCSGYTVSYERAGISLSTGHNIVLTEGTTNTVKSGNSENEDSYGILFKKTSETVANPTISGKGTLNVTSGTAGTMFTSVGISCNDGALTFKEATILATAAASATSGCGIEGSSIIVESGNITATGAGTNGYGISVTGQDKGMTMTGGIVTASGKAAAIITKHSITAYNATVTGEDSGFISGGTVKLIQADPKVPVVISLDQSITPITATFDKNSGATNYKDIVVTQTLTYTELKSIKNDGTALIRDSAYTVSVSGNTTTTITIKKEYLATLAVGTTTLTFNYDTGTAPTLTITVSDSTPGSNAVPPTINTNLSTTEVNYITNATATHLTIAATVTDSGALTYQWYSNTTNSNTGGTAITGATTVSYAPLTTKTGTTYYYCVVKNTNDKATGETIATTTSAIAKITVNDLVDAANPNITTNLKIEEVTYDKGAVAVTPLAIAATAPDGGTLTYQWYSNTNNNNTGGTAIGSATTASYTPPTANVGTVYYYCVVKNINNSATGAKTATTTSNVATIKTVLSDADKVKAAKGAADAALAAFTPTNDTDDRQVMAAVTKALTDAHITGVAPTWDSSNPFIKTLATVDADGSVTGTINLTCKARSGETAEVVLNKTIAKIPLDPVGKVTAVKAAIENALKTYIATNTTTADEIKTFANDKKTTLGLQGVEDVKWKSPSDFKNKNSTDFEDGNVTGTLLLKCTQDGVIAEGEVLVNCPIERSDEQKLAAAKIALANTITAANDAKKGVYSNDASSTSSVSNGTKYVTTAEMKALTDAIAAAEAVAKKRTSATAAEVTAATTALNAAVNTFKTAIKIGTRISSPNVDDTTNEPKAPTTDTTIVPETAKTEVSAEIDGSGNASVTVTDESITDAIKKAQAENKKNGTENKGIAIELSIDTGGEKSDSITTNLPKSVQDTLVKGNVSEFKVSSQTASLTFDNKTLQEIQNQAGGDATINASKADVSTLSQEAQDEIGNRPVFDLSITGANGNSVSDFGGGSVTVSIPYTLQDGENPTNLQAYFIGAGGEINEVICSYDPVTQCLVFLTNHFSAYGIGYKENVPKFNDIGKHWAKSDIEFVSVRGLLTGTSDGRFDPDSPVTTRDLAVALAKLSGKDVSTIVKNAGEDAAISRQEVAVVMQNFAKMMNYTFPKTRELITFADNESIGGWEAEAVKSMQMAGIIMGKDGNIFAPTTAATRAEVSAVLRRYVELIVNRASTQGLDINDSGSVVCYENGKLVKSESQNAGDKNYVLHANGEVADVPKTLTHGTYIVKKGDSFWKIARQHKCDIYELARINGMTIFSTIHAGDVLQIPQ